MTNRTRPWYKQPRCRLIFYYLVQFLLLSIVSLPTIFYVYQPVHPQHANSTKDGYEKLTNKTWGLAARNVSDPLCNSPLVYDNVTKACRAPCAWSSLSDAHRTILYSLMVVAFWLALFATIITTITWANISNLRKYPHVLRFYLMICCILLACCKMLPLRIGLEKVFCHEHKYWSPTGISSTASSIQGAACHYLSLAQSFWAMCFVVNTYQVIVRDNKIVFNHPIFSHLVQSLFCWVVPAVVVVICLLLDPGYKFLFVDFLAAGPGSMAMTYYASTLPVQISLGISLCLLWSIVWCLRSARLDSARRVIRSQKESLGMKRVERQFTSIAFVILVVVGVVLTIATFLMYRVRHIVHQVEMYFDCLQVSKQCEVPSYSVVMSAVSTMSPGFLCLIFFLLLFRNKDCRQVWKNYFQKVYRLFVRAPLPKTLDDKSRSRCSSTLTVLSERRDSATASQNYILQLPIESRTRSSSCNPLTHTTDFVLRIQLTPTLKAESRVRSCSSPTAQSVESPPGFDIVRSFAISLPDLVDRKTAQHTLQFNLDLKEAHSAPMASGTRQILDTDEQLSRL